MQEALCLLENLRFEVLVSDLGLPDGNGLDLVVEAKKRQPWKKTVALTAHECSGDKELGLRAGFDEYLTKPFDFHQLRSLLAEAPEGGGAVHVQLGAGSGVFPANATPAGRKSS